MKRICIIISLISLLTSCIAGQQSNKYIFKTFSVDEMRTDLKSLYGKLDTAHYNLYHLHTKSEFDSIYHNIYYSIDQPLNIAEFYFRLLPLFNLLRDSHSLLGFPFSYNKEYSKQGGLFIPIRVFIADNKIYVSKNLSSSSFPLYSEIKTINGISSAEILCTLHLMTNQEQQESESDYMAFFFHRILYPVYGFDKSYILELATPDNHTKQVQLSGISLEKFTSENIPYFSSKLLDKSTILIDINNCEDKKQFAVFCDSIFKSIQYNKIESLVIDLRDNPGGSTFHGDTLFTYLTNQKFTQYPKRSIKYSPYSIPKSDSIYTQTFSDNLEQAHSNKFLFKGKVFILINRGTFSSASVMAATFKCYKLGTLIGQPTGGTQIFYDEPLEFKLTNSRLRFLVSNQINYCPCGTDWNMGIVPDKNIEISIVDRIKGVDTELEFVKSLIKEINGSH